MSTIIGGTTGAAILEHTRFIYALTLSRWWGLAVCWMAASSASACVASWTAIIRIVRSF